MIQSLTRLVAKGESTTLEVTRFSVSPREELEHCAAGGEVFQALLGHFSCGKSGKLGARVWPGNTFADEAAESSVGIRPAIDALAGRAPLAWSDATCLVDPSQHSRVSEFQPCLPPEIERGLIACETMSVDDANATLGEWKRSAMSHEGEK